MTINWFVILLINIALSNSLFPQAFDTSWTRIIGGTGIDVGIEIIQTSDGGFAAAGYTTSFGVLQRDVYVIRLDSSGNTLWEKTYGSALLEQAYSIKETQDGGFIISAFKYLNSSNLWLIRTDSNGDTLWTKNIGYSGNEFGTNLQLTDDGGFLVTGYTDSDTISNGNRDAWFIKLDSSGTKLWEKTYGNSNADEGYKLLKLSDNNFLISGYTTDASRNGWIVKTDISGNLIWDKVFGGNGFDEFNSATEDENGNLYLTGTTDSLGNRDLWIIKTDPYGNQIFTKTYGGLQLEWGFDIVRAGNGNLIIIGSNQSNSTGLSQLWMLKIDEQGDTLSTKLFTTENGSGGNSITNTSDDGFAITGSAGNDVFIIKLKPENLTNIRNNISKIPGNFSLAQNYPNPFNPTTTIEYSIPYVESRDASSLQHVLLKVYDILGKEVTILINEEKSPGSYKIEFDSSLLPSGVYFYKLQAGNFTKTKKMVLLK